MKISPPGAGATNVRRAAAFEPLIVTLQQRWDYPLHFLISALVAAEAGTPLADAVGLWKELTDARRGGSGFSFEDLAADRAGTRFGELAIRDPARLQARITQQRAELERGEAAIAGVQKDQQLSRCWSTPYSTRVVRCWSPLMCSGIP